MLGIPARPLLRPSLAVATTLMLAACAPPPSGPGTVDEPELEPIEVPAAVDPESAEQRARDLEDAADDAAGMRQEELRLRAASAWLEAGEARRAQRNLDRADLETYPQLVPQAMLVRAEFSLAQGQAEDALETLRIVDLPDRLYAERLRVRAQALFTLDRPVAAVGALVERGELDGVDTYENQRRIWRGLTRPLVDVGALERSVEDRHVEAWLELARAYRALPPADPIAMLETTLREHPELALDPRLRFDLRERISERARMPRRIAVLLPLSGRVASAGEAVRDGMIAAQLGLTPQRRPELLFLDTVAHDVERAYDEARMQGAEMIVGPLLRDDVETLARQRPDLPVLALNYLEDTRRRPREDFFQYALSPEDEAEQAAERVMADGLYAGIALIPDNDMGQRMLTRFRGRLRTLGGDLLSWQTYDPGESDQQAPITAMLGLQDSRRRHRTLTNAIGDPTEFEPRRRQDVDFIYLVAEPRQGRLIRPQLRFHYASDLPVFASSAIHEVGTSPDENIDLNGVRFSAMPWKLQPEPGASALLDAVSRHWPPGSLRRAELYAMGLDAMRLVPALLYRSPTLVEAVPGHTGTLFLGEDGRIHRRLAWAEVRRGVPTLDQGGWQSLAAALRPPAGR